MPTLPIMGDTMADTGIRRTTTRARFIIHTMPMVDMPTHTVHIIRMHMDLTPTDTTAIRTQVMDTQLPATTIVGAVGDTKLILLLAAGEI